MSQRDLNTAVDNFLCATVEAVMAALGPFLLILFLVAVLGGR
jgi:hypothetical protein